MAESSKAAAAPAATGLADEIYRELRKMIVKGKLAPGSRLVETQISEHFDVSRGTVRSALERLHGQGLAVHSGSGRQSRLSVAPVTKEDARELYFLVGEIEALAALWATQRTPAEVRSLATTLRSLNREILELEEAGDLTSERFLELDRNFHWAFVEAGGARTRGLLQSLRPQMERYAQLYSASIVGGGAALAVDEHAAIIEAFEAGDPEAVADAVRANWRKGAARLDTIIDHTGEWGMVW